MPLREIIADLHNHSTASDGEFTPAELVSKSREAGLKAVGLTDHDTIAGLNEAVEAGDKLNVTVIPGVEASLRFKRPFFVGSLHLLLYFSVKRLNDSAFRNDLTRIIRQGRGIALVRDRVDAINREFGPDSREPLLKKPLTADEITSQADNITRRHFFLALSKNHNIVEKRLMDRIIGNSSPAYIPSGIDMSILYPFFKQYRVVKVLAHPAAGSFPGESHYKEVLPSIDIVEQLMPEFVDHEGVGLDGLEVYYPAHTKQFEEILINWAGRYELLITGGSDCHDRHNRPLGITGLTQNELDTFLKKIDEPA